MTDLATRATGLLDRASHVLRTASPLEAGLERVVREALSLEPGDPRYFGHPEPFRADFSELAPRNLAIGLEPGGPAASAGYRIETGTDAVRQLVGTNMGRDAAMWLDRRSEEARGSGYGASSWGAAIGAAFDRDGLHSATVSYEWGPSLMDSLPASLYRIARTAMELVPGLRPSYSTIHIDRFTGSQLLTFETTNALSLASLEPLMRALGLGHRHAGLMSVCGFVLGARFVLPPGAATITLRPTPEGIEFRLDVDLDRLPDVPDPLAPLLQMQMTERPGSLREWHAWLSAFTQEGYDRPGSFSVLSIVVHPKRPPRLLVHLRPAVVESPPDGDGVPAWAGPEAMVAR